MSDQLQDFYARTRRFYEEVVASELTGATLAKSAEPDDQGAEAVPAEVQDRYALPAWVLGAQSPPS